MRILIIEDDKNILHFLKTGLETEGFVVDVAKDGIKGESLASINEYSLILLDLNLPKKSGDEICNKLRSDNIFTPIIILSVEEDIESKVRLLNSGADDYMLKPFSFSELLARIKALLRRPHDLAKSILQFNDLILDQDKQVLIYKNRTVYLTRKEFCILEHLMRNCGKIISRASIMENAWDSEADIFSKAIETHILNLRKKIDKDNPEKIIKTVSGRGYIIG